MIKNFDRENEAVEFTASTKNVIFFINAKDNGMTTFLLHELKNNAYIFVAQNYKGDVIIDSADKKASKFQDDRNEMFNIILNFEEMAKYSTNLLYFVPTFGTFLRNTYRDTFEELIKKNNEIKYSLENFLSDYFLQFGNKTLFLIAEHAEKFGNNFISKLKIIADKFSKIRLIFTFDAAAASAEIISIFNNYDTINFCKPNFKNAVKIFDGLALDRTVYNKDMYNESSSILDFLSKYYIKMNELHLSNPVDTAINSLLSNFDCYFNEKFLFLIVEYLKNCRKLDDGTDSLEIKNRLLSTRIISKQGDLFKYNLSYNLNNDSILYNGFVSFLLNSYKEINYDVLYFILVTTPTYLTSEILLYLALNYNSEAALTKIIEALRFKEELSFDKYCMLYAHLFNLKLFHLIPKYNGTYEKTEKNIILLLDTIAKEKQHLKTSAKIYKQNIKKYAKINNDFACLNEILFLDYSINHNRKYIKLITQKNSPYSIRHFTSSKYFYILQNIVAFYLTDKNQTIMYYNESIQQAAENEELLLLNNKFAYQIMEYINNNISLETLNKTYFQLSSSKFFTGIYNSFINHNIFLYESITEKKNKFPKPETKQDNMTWELFKKLNYYTCKFVFEDLNIEEFLSLRNEVLNSNRFPSCNFYYYNLFIIAKACGNIKQIKIAKKYLNYNKNFKTLQLHKKYKQIKNKPCQFFKDKKLSLVKFGLIFSRLFDLDYLLKAIAEITK